MMPAYENMGWLFGIFGDLRAGWRGTSRWIDAKAVIRNLLRNERRDQHDQISSIVGSEEMMIDLDM